MSSIDWRNEGAVAPVRDQGHCGSSYAIAATGALEGQYFTQYRELTELSIQNILDCSSSFGNDGCDGGFIEASYNYIISTGGIDSEKAYPYEAQNGTCRFNRTAIVANCSVKNLSNKSFNLSFVFSVIITSNQQMKMLLHMPLLFVVRLQSLSTPRNRPFNSINPVFMTNLNVRKHVRLMPV